MEWNAGGWFGGQIGATVWMFVAGMLTAFRDIPTGIVVMLLFTVPNAIGFILWQSRKLSCYASTQFLIGISGVFGLLTVYILESSNTWLQIQSGDQISASSTYWVIGLVFGGLMIMFYLRFGRSKNRPEA